MADVITLTGLSEWLEDESVATSSRAGKIIELTNKLINENWATPIDPAPAWVESLALTVATRAWVNKPGKGPVESETRAFDDSSKTTRYAVRASDGSEQDVFLTEAQLDALGARPSSPVGNIRLHVPRTMGYVG
jgi:chitodextrinase